MHMLDEIENATKLAEHLAANWINGNLSDVREALEALGPVEAAAVALAVLNVLNEQPGDADQRFAAALQRWAEAGR